MLKEKENGRPFSLGALRERLAEGPLCDFFMGKWYPLAVCALVLIGHVFALEIWTNILIMLSASLALIICPSVRPIIPAACNYVFQLSVEHSPALPNYSDYCFSGWRLPIVVAMFVCVALAFAYFAVKNKIFRGISLTRTPLLLPLLVLSAAFLLGGVFSPEWTPASLVFGIAQVFWFVFFFVYFYFGMRMESRDQMADTLAYTSALTVLVLVGELVARYVKCDGVIVDGEIVKGQILFGWGVWNSMGVALCMLIPACFIGVVRQRGVRSFLYLGAALLALVGAVMTLSRNALLFGAVFFAASVIFACFVGAYRRFYRVIAALGVLLVLAAVILLFDRIPELVGAFLFDNGRFTLWRMGIEKFLSAPIFGTGFFAFEFPDDPNYFVGASFLPSFVHQTFVQLLSSMGLFGLLSYLYYRVSTVACALRRPDPIRLLLFLTSLVLPVMSLIDTFIFNLWPIIHYSITLAVMCKDGGEEQLPDRI